LSVDWWWWNKLGLLIGGGGAICENACHCDTMHHPFAHSKLAKTQFFSWWN
jgi:hypothetical protein